MQDITTEQLTEKQAAFVEYYVSSGGKVGIAATKAGYSAREQGSRLLRDPKIIKIIQQRMMDEIGVAAVSALTTVKKLAKSARSDYVRLEAAKDLLDRAGYKPPERVDHRVAADLSVSFDVAPRQIEGSVVPDGSPEDRGGQKRRVKASDPLSHGKKPLKVRCTHAVPFETP